MLSHQSQCRHFLSHLLPSGISSSVATSSFVPSLLSRSEKFRGFFANTLGNAKLKLKIGNLLESRVGFFGFELPSESRGFTGFQKRGWKSWIKGGNGAVFGLIIANVAVFTMWRVSERNWMIKNFMLSKYHLMSGRIHTLITSGFSHIGISQIAMNMLGLYYFGTRIARTLGPVYLLKLYVAGSLGSSVVFLGNQAFMGKSLESSKIVTKDKSRPRVAQQQVVTLQGADGSVYAIMLLDIFLYPKVTTYFGFVLRVPAMIAVLFLGNDMLKLLQVCVVSLEPDNFVGKLQGVKFSISSSPGQLGGIVVAAMAWKRLRRGRFC